MPEVIAQGADLVSFPVINYWVAHKPAFWLAKKVLIDKIRKHPLYRALRPDKLCLAALSATLLHYLKGDYEQEIPLYRMLSQSEAQIKQRLKPGKPSFQTAKSFQVNQRLAGGAVCPAKHCPPGCFNLSPNQQTNCSTRSARESPPIIARIQEQSVVLDPARCKLKKNLSSSNV